MKTVSIYLIKRAQYIVGELYWIFDCSEKTATKILEDWKSDSKTLEIERVPCKDGTMTLSINKTEIAYVTVK